MSGASVRRATRAEETKGMVSPYLVRPLRSLEEAAREREANLSAPVVEDEETVRGALAMLVREPQAVADRPHAEAVQGRSG